MMFEQKTKQKIVSWKYLVFSLKESWMEANFISVVFWIGILHTAVFASITICNNRLVWKPHLLWNIIVTFNVTQNRNNSLCLANYKGVACLLTYRIRYYSGLVEISLNSDHKSQLYLKGDVARSITRTKNSEYHSATTKYYIFCILSPGYCTYFSIPFLWYKLTRVPLRSKEHLLSIHLPWLNTQAM